MNKIVRTPSRVKGGITPEEKQRLDAHAAKWIANAMSTEPVNPTRLTAAIKSLYAAADLKEPRVVIVSSPRVMAFAGGFAAAIWWARKNGKKAMNDGLATDDATRAATDDATYAATAAATDDATAAATYAATDDADFFQIAEQIGKEFGVAPKLMLQCAQNWWRLAQGGNMWSAYDSYLSAFREVLGLVLPTHEKYKAWEACTVEGGYRVVHEEFCIVSDRPEILRVDNENRPHCENGPSHRWRDGWCLYHWHGVKIPGEWVTGKPPSAKDALTWPNIEQRRAACEIVGWAKILEQLDARVIDADGDPEIGTLLEATIPDSGKERFLSVKCGTGRSFVLPVPREMKSAIQANAWTYGLDPQQFSPEVRT